MRGIGGHEVWEGSKMEVAMQSNTSRMQGLGPNLESDSVLLRNGGL